MKPPAKAVLDAINLKMADEGGQLVRARAVEGGRVQYWVVRGGSADQMGRTVVASTIYELAQGLGISLERDVKKKPEKANMKDAITTERAGFITGYSAGRINKAVADGEIPTADGMKPRRGKHTLVRRSDVLEWVKKHTETSALRHPRKKGWKHGTPSKNGHAASPKPRMGPMLTQGPGDASERLSRYLEKFKGTPLEMTKEQFIQLVVEQALNKLGA